MIIYNPFLPPNSRSLTIEEFSRDCGRVKWREERIKSLDGTKIALCVADVPPVSQVSAGKAKHPVYILYFQGNASSLPPRLPDLSWIIRRAHDNEPSVNYTLSIGCGFATNLAAKGKFPPNIKLNGLILETPFTKVRAMLQALYPQKWLPYQYLWPFLRNHLDSWTNLGMIAKRFPDTPPGIYIVEAGKDELVPANHGEELLQRCQQVGLPVERQKVRGALHNEAMVRVSGKQALAQSISTAATRAREQDSLGKGEDVNNAGDGLT
ncbi:hypothetical protein H9Q70_005733 [Fusarium xylarioides]|nr:hypothetical protein H9Q70_005733 [Fusarium xylarioides]KAG5780347.1 hypothetical protein H9Q73_005973 [Fusarium xylarioides]